LFSKIIELYTLLKIKLIINVIILIQPIEILYNLKKFPKIKLIVLNYQLNWRNPDWIDSLRIPLLALK